MLKNFSLRTSLLILATCTAAAACEQSDSDISSCSLTELKEVVTDDIYGFGVVILEDSTVEASLKLRSASTPSTQGYIQLGEGQALTIEVPEDGTGVVGTQITMEATEPTADGCGPIAYEASGNVELLGRDFNLTLTGPGASPKSASVYLPTVTVTSPPESAKLDESFDVPIDAELPTAGGYGLNQSWYFEARGACVTPSEGENFALVDDGNQFGSDQRPTQGSVIPLTLSSVVFSPGAEGCDVELTLVIRTNENSPLGELSSMTRQTFTLSLTP